MIPTRQVLFSNIFILICGWALIVKGQSVSSSISPSRTTSIAVMSSSSLPTMPVPVPPTTPTTPTTPMTTVPPKQVARRTYDIEYTLAKYPWKSTYPKALDDIYTDLVNLMYTIQSSFQKGNFKDLIRVWYQNMTGGVPAMASNDTGQVQAHLRVTFTAAPAASQEPEMFLFSQNAKEAFGNYTFERIMVRENVTGGVTLGKWEGGTCHLCCGQRYTQNRTCVPKANCSGLITNRTITCHWKCALQCGTVRKFTFSFTLNYAWKDDYSKPQTEEYKKLYDTLTKGDESLLSQVTTIFTESKKTTAYKETSNKLVVSRAQDNVRVSIAVMFGEPPSRNANDPEALFRFKTESGQLGNFKINIKSIMAKEHTFGYTFSSWTTNKDGCTKCCGGEVTQTRTCTSVVGSCGSNAQLARKIKCNHVCSKVQCSGAYVCISGLFMTCSFLLMSILI